MFSSVVVVQLVSGVWCMCLAVRKVKKMVWLVQLGIMHLTIIPGGFSLSMLVYIVSSSGLLYSCGGSLPCLLVFQDSVAPEA